MTPNAGISRIPIIDQARGFALLAMTVYHFTWDLSFFAWISPVTVAEPGWVWFARSIAISFLFLVGVSLYLANSEVVNGKKFTRRLLQIIAAAAISLATWFVFPAGFIFFGILHAIALFSVLGLLFLRLPWWLSLMAAAAVIAVDQWGEHPVFTEPYLWWVGLAPQDPPSNDYVPLFPWFAATLVGIAFAKLAVERAWLDRLRSWVFPAKLANPLSFIGRHSLIYYLAHQPILIALIWGFTQLAGPPDRTGEFVDRCTTTCEQTRNGAFCKNYCSCLLKELKHTELFTPFMEGQINNSEAKSVDGIQRLCVNLYE